MRFRFLPVAIFATILMFGVKVGNLVLGVDGSAVAPSHAQDAAKPAPQKGADAGQKAAPGKAPAPSGVAASPGGVAKAQGEKPAPKKPMKPKPGDLPSDPTL